jgi:uncharacterized membrane protein/2-hydroxychromene-2-carboxylate isomerase
VGVLLSADLLRLHVRVHTDPGYHSYCAVTEYVDCESVAMSGYAVFAGLPVALWGLLGYLFVGGLCIWGLRRSRQPGTWPFGLLLGLSLIAVTMGGILFYISHWRIQSLCIVCTAAYVVNLILCGLAVGALKKQNTGIFAALRDDLRQLAELKRPALAYGLSFVAGAAVLWLIIPSYWQIEAATGPGGLPVGETSEGSHWIGARDPAVEIVEFSDYQCPYCSRAHAEVRLMVEMNPDKIRLVHRHYPLRSHRHAFDYAMMAHCAGQQNRFWEANDYLFANGQREAPVTAGELAGELQIDAGDLEACRASAEARQAVLEDVQAGRAFRIRGTPTFIIGDKHYPGRIPETVLESLLAD